MIFSEIYSAYYNAVASLINAAIDGELNEKNAYDYINNHAFKESFLYILEAIKKEQWQVITKDFKTPIKHYARMPLTLLQKRFLKAIVQDKRFKLFSDITMDELEDVEPLYTKEDLYYFDIVKDGDPYNDCMYIEVFRTVLKALKERRRLRIVYKGNNGKRHSGTYTPSYLEYSEKDDKFRLICPGRNKDSTINIARIKECKLLEEYIVKSKPVIKKKECITTLITDERNALERCMLHFSNYRKCTKQLDNRHYEMKLTYNKEDETEILIRVLSFGPMLRVIEPQSFINQIKDRLNLQRKNSSQLFFNDKG